MNKLALSIGALALAFVAKADLITFDSLSGYSDLVPNGYHGLNWVNFYYMNTPMEASYIGASGYSNGTVSGHNVAFNGYADPADITAVGTSTFALNSGYFIGAWNNDLKITALGYLHGSLVDSTSFAVSSTTPTLETFNWQNLDKVEFRSSGGTAAGYSGQGYHFAVDNLMVNGTAAVPEPFTSALAIGTAVASFRRLRRSKRA